jgi:site-specific DNA recombinase
MLWEIERDQREVTGERIRDKIAASKRKGLWMGGLPPLGYDAADGQLRINEAEAATVCHIFQRYLALGTVDALCKDLARDGIGNKTYPRPDGSSRGGGRLQRGAVYRMLQNPVYRGLIRHKVEVYPGQHAAIIEEELWRAVQAKLAAGQAGGGPHRDPAGGGRPDPPT